MAIVYRDLFTGSNAGRIGYGFGYGVFLLDHFCVQLVVDLGTKAVQQQQCVL